MFNSKIKNIIGYSPQKISLYRKAFTHSSLNIKDSESNPYNFERLEYLGDSVLNLVVASHLFSNLSSMSLFKLRELKKDYQKLGYSTVGIEVYENKIFSVPIYLSIMTLLSAIIMFNSKFRKSKIFNIILGISLSVIIYYVNYFSSLLGETGKIPIILSVWLPLIILVLISLIGLVRLNEK